MNTDTISVRPRRNSSGCACRSTPEAADVVPYAAFDALRRHVNELAIVVHELSKGQPHREATLMQGLRDRAMRIVGGEETRPGEFPDCALVGRRSGSGTPRWFCSGVLIHKRVVLTAAHCLLPGAPNVVALNADDIGDLSEAEVLEVHRSFIHPHYNETSLVANHDIGILVLAAEARTPRINVTSAEQLAGATRITPVGFGNNDIYSSRGFGVKRKVTIDIQALRRGPQEDLNAEETLYGFESDDELVAGDPSMDSCNGDSGGPAYVYAEGEGWLVAGLTSRGIREKSADSPPCGEGGIYTRIDVHWPWIQDTVSRYL